MNKLTNNQPAPKGLASAWDKIKTLLSAKTISTKNEIDYYHQYVFPYKANKLLKEQKNQGNTSYVPFAKRQSKK